MTQRQTLDYLIDLFAPEIRDAFLAAMQDVVDNAIISDVIDAIQNGDVVTAFEAIGFSPAAMRPITQVIEQAFERGGVLTGQTFPKYVKTTSGRGVFRFDVRNSRAEAWLRDHSSSLVTRLTDEARVNVQQVLQRGVTAGRGPRAIALDLVGRIDPATGRRTGGIIGLTNQQENWVANTRQKLNTLDQQYFDMTLRDKRFDRTVAKAIRENKPLPQETVDKLTNSYKNNALKYRAETVGRTEAVQSLNQSEYEAHLQAVDNGSIKEKDVRRHWDSAGDARTRHSHSAIDAKYRVEGVGLKEPFISPVTGASLMYPGDRSLGAPAKEVINCRCRVRLKVDWLAGWND